MVTIRSFLLSVFLLFLTGNTTRGMENFWNWVTGNKKKVTTTEKETAKEKTKETQEKIKETQEEIKETQEEIKQEIIDKIKKKLEEKEKTPQQQLFEAAKIGDNEKIIELLENENVKIDDRISKNSYSALFIAAGNNQPATVELLLNRKANPNIADKNLNTPLHIAVYKGFDDIIDLLLTNGADLFLKNNLGETPLKLAEKKLDEATVISYDEQVDLEKRIEKLKKEELNKKPKKEKPKIEEKKETKEEEEKKEIKKEPTQEKPKKEEKPSEPELINNLSIFTNKLKTLQSSLS